MEQPDSFPSSSSSVNRETSGGDGPPSEVREEEGFHRFNHFHHDYDHDRFNRNTALERHHVGVSHRGNAMAFNDGSAAAYGDDKWSCVVVVFTFCFFVSMTLILGVYGSVNLRLGPYCSMLIQPNPMFVQSIKVEELDAAKHDLSLYGMYKSPSLDAVATWSEPHTLTVPVDSHKEWIYDLNMGSEINISYSLESSSYSIFIIIAQGSESLAQWLEDPTYPNSTLSWNLVHGSGMIQQHIYKSSSYYIAVGNLNVEKVKAKLNFGIKKLMYNTTEAYYKCTFTDGQCSVIVRFPEGNAVVLATPGPEQNTSSYERYVRISYEPRWITYIFGIAGMSAFMLVVFNFLNKFQSNGEDGTVAQQGGMGSERAPLLSSKDDDLSSLGSSYDSVSSGDEDFKEKLGSTDGKSVQDGENSNNTRRLCAICFDAPRDCFFLPCGHCVACFDCGTRIAEALGTCPICRRNMKKVRKIFTV